MNLATFLMLMEEEESPLLFRYRPGDAGYTATRASDGAYVDSSSAIQTASSDVLRDSHYIGGVRTTLLESQRTNVLPRSDTLATGWSVTSATVANAVGTYANRPFSRITGITSGSTEVRQDFTGLTGNAVKAFSVLYKSNGVDGDMLLGFYDLTAGAWRLQSIIHVASGVITLTSTAIGTHIRTEVLADGVYRFHYTTTSCTAANTHRFYVCHGFGASLTSVLPSGCQIEDATFPSSIIPTAAGTVTRSVDSFTLPAVASNGTLFYRYYDMATAAWVNAASAYTGGTTIEPALDRAYSTIAVLRGTKTAAECAALLGL